MTFSPDTGEQPVDPDTHAATVNRMFSRMARTYDLQNHVFSLGIDLWWYRQLARMVVPGPTRQVLDLAAGTLKVTLDVCRRYPEVQVTAVDISQAMLDYGYNHRAKKAERERITPLVADARALPLRDNAFDAVTIAFGIRNVAPRDEALAEIYRVLTPGGRACILEFAPVTTPLLGSAYHWYLERILPRLAGLISDSREAFEYFATSIQNFPTPPDFCQELTATGFPFVQHIPFTLGIANLYIAIKA